VVDRRVIRSRWWLRGDDEGSIVDGERVFFETEHPLERRASAFVG
jgi:hypothetical protein